jgi:predicted signal transduction protein with EAL and GGDEF domain
MIDIDDFKEINDLYSYKVGDSAAIKAIGSALKEAISATDLVPISVGKNLLRDNNLIVMVRDNIVYLKKFRNLS